MGGSVSGLVSGWVGWLVSQSVSRSVVSRSVVSRSVVSWWVGRAETLESVDQMSFNFFIGDSCEPH